ncbi:E3 ubiquitin-protein ligase TRIM39-like [Leucoraja erinacea]|uniref:E3 ubiquitin-protein ligase TRIM39-like n=1 Tax=Leucoraja erinaceus TaxID=7782 RepID=UPI002454F772|nr:E3 ubiquitin-protein ligase TRIM39-like [Leucoraja erinacea]
MLFELGRGGVKMASKDEVESWTEEVICPICLDFFTDPVSLECGENFCRSCITQSWDREGRNSCPECRKVFTDRTLRVNRALARLSEKARTLSLNRTEEENKLQCEEHQEELKLFCETDKKLICVVCAAGREHRDHRFMPVKEAVKNYKDQIKSSIQSHKKEIRDPANGAATEDFWSSVSVTLDVETAHPLLEVSEDRKRVRRTRTRRCLPDTGKRFTDWACLLGSEGFTSGRHYWEVEVAGSQGWSLGVAAESVERKRRCTPSPDTGIWGIWRDGEQFEAVTSPPSRIPNRPVPARVGVYLCYESGTVSFYDADTKSHLHTFSENKFTEKLYPFFGPWEQNQWLRICSSSAPDV